MAISFASANDDLRAINVTMDEKAINRAAGSAECGTFWNDDGSGAPCAVRHDQP
jgi:hypothetical protein